jgi:hypothetical protein
VRLLYAYYDCENIIAYYVKRERHNPLGNLTKEEVAALMEERNYSLLPKRMAKVVKNYVEVDDDERDEDVVPPLLLDELFVTVPDERLVLVLPLPWRKLLFLLLVLTLLLLLPVELVPVLLIRVEVLELP